MKRNWPKSLLLVVAPVVVVAVVLLVVHGPGRPTSLFRGARVRPVVGLFAADPARPLEAGFSSLVDRLSQSFEVREVDLSAPGALDSLDVLLMVGSGHLPDAKLYDIDQFLMRGGRAAFLLDGAELTADRSEASVVRGNLFAFAEAYGATAEPDLVVDVSGGSRAYTAASGPYAFWPIGVPEESRLAREIVPRGEDVVFAWTSSLSIRDRAISMATVLARSSLDSWSTIAFTSVAPDFEPEPDRTAALGGATPRGSYALAVALQGTFRSAFAGAPVIVEKADGTVEFTDPVGRLEESTPTRMAMLGSSRMFEDLVVSVAPANLEFITNLVSWLGDGRAGR